MKKRSHGLRGGENRLMLGLLLPSVLFVLVISIVPLAYTFFLSFQNYSLLNSDGAHFNGIQNYIEIVSNPAIRQSVWVTFQYTISSIALSTLVGVGLAVVVNQIKKGKSFFRVVFFVPMMLSGIVVGVLWRFLFSTDLGVINYLLEIVGVGRINWTGSATAAMASILIADVWQWSSYTFINALAALEAMNPEPVEAAKVDGANALQLFFLIKLPAIMPVVGVSIVFRTVWAFRSFDLIYSLTSGGPGTSTTTMAIEIYRRAFNQYKIGASSALSVLMFLILTGLSLFILKKTLKGEPK